MKRPKITISISETALKKLDEMAAADSRNRSHESGVSQKTRENHKPRASQSMREDHLH